MGRSMIGGGEGASVAEVAASLPARRLGAMKNCEVLKIGMKEKKRKEIRSLKVRSILREVNSLFQPIGLL